jgi:hypothetical protein
VIEKHLNSDENILDVQSNSPPLLSFWVPPVQQSFYGHDDERDDADVLVIHKAQSHEILSVSSPLAKL